MTPKKRRVVKIGTLPVDAGVMMLSDPCYVIGEERDPTLYDRICQAICRSKKPYVLVRSDNRASLNDVLIASTGGDGVFPVYAELDEHGWLAAITIRFDDSAIWEARQRLQAAQQQRLRHPTRAS
jgi:hypothetical protein